MSSWPDPYGSSFRGWSDYTSGGGYPWQYAQTSATNVTWYPQSVVVNAPAPETAEPEPVGPLEWLRSQVGEICELAKAA